MRAGGSSPLLHIIATKTAVVCYDNNRSYQFPAGRATLASPDMLRWPLESQGLTPAPFIILEIEYS